MHANVRAGLDVLTGLRVAKASGETLSDAEAEQELERLLTDPRLELPQRGRACLRYLANAKFRGETKADAYAMARELFNRDRDFNPVHDPIVRIEIARLRRALEQYYQSHGRMVSAQIIIQHGNYIPRFVATGGSQEVQLDPSATSDVASGHNAESASEDSSGNPTRPLVWQLSYYIAVSGAALAIAGGLATSIWIFLHR